MALSEYDIHRRNLKLGIATNPVKEKKGIALVSEKQKEKNKAAKPQKDLQDEWFEERIAELTDCCQECGGKTKSAIYVMAKESIAHLLPKRKSMFPSVATHKENWIELCIHCHTNYDSSWEAAAQMKIWPTVVQGVLKIYPSIAAVERKNLPEILRQEINI